jgi:hypothetical protein
MTDFFIKDTEIFYNENFLTFDEMQYLDQKISQYDNRIKSLIKLSGKTENDAPANSHAKIRNIEIVSDKEDARKMDAILDRIKQTIYDYIDSSIYEMWTRPLKDIHCHYPPFFLHEHYDAEGDVGKNVKYGIVLYLTDEFDGGELVYTKKNISVKPKKGSLIIHPSSEEYTHKLEPVTSGIRISVPSFVYENFLS